MKRIFIVVLAVLLLAAFPGVAFASEDTEKAEEASGGGIGICYTYINCTAIDFDINASGYATMYADVYAISGSTTRLSAYLQRYDGGWGTVQHYSKSSDTNFCYWSAGRYVTSGYQYRLLVYYYAYYDGSSERTSMTSYEYY